MKTPVRQNPSPRGRLFTLPLGVLLALSQTVTGATFSWITAGDGNWGTTANWQGGTLPGLVAGDTTLFNAPGVNANEIIYIGAANRDIPGFMVFTNTGTTTLLGGTAGSGATVTLTGLNNITVEPGAGAVSFGGPGAVVNVSTDAGGIMGYSNNSTNLLTFNGTLGSNSTTRPVVLGGSGDILLNGALIQSRNLVKHGAGTVTLTVPNTGLTNSTAAAIVGGGTLKLTDTATLPTMVTHGFKLSRQGTLLLDNTGTTNSTDRLADNSPIASELGGGTFLFQGANDAASAETVGALTTASGVLTVRSVTGADTPAAGTPTNTLTFASLGTRAAGATLVFSGTGLGVDGTNKVVFTAAPTLANHLIGAYATVGNEFATYNQDGAGNANNNGVQPFAPGAYTSVFGASNHVKLTTGGALEAAANSLNLQTVDGASFTVSSTLTTGAILNSNSGTGANDISGGAITNGTGELVITANNDLSISSDITGNGVLTKSGAGTMTLSSAGATRTSVNVFINQGTLKLTSPTAIYDTANSISGTIFVGASATLDLAGNTTWTTSGRIPGLRLNDTGATLKVSGGSTFSFDKNIVVASLLNNPTSVALHAASGSDTINLLAAVQNLTSNTAAPVIGITGAGTVTIGSVASNATAATAASNGSYAWDVTGGGKLLVYSTGANPLGLTGNSVEITSGTVGLGSDNTAGYGYVLNGGTLSGAGGGTRTIATVGTIRVDAPSVIDLKDAAVGATANMNLNFGGVISGTGALTLVATGSGAGTLTLNGANTHTGGIAVSSGTLALGTGGSLATGNSVAIAAGATFDVSALTASSATYTWTAASLRASGTSTAATLVGSSGGIINIDTKPIQLTWSGASSGTDTTHPPLTVTGAELALYETPFTVVVPGTALGIGQYTLVNAAAISPGSSVHPVPLYTGGNGVAAGLVGVVSISGSSVILTVSTAYTLTYDGNGNDGGAAPTDGPFAIGSTVTVLGSGTLTRTGFTFAGWNTAADGSGAPRAEGSTFTITANTTLYAQWTASYTVTYDGNGATTGLEPVDTESPYPANSVVTVLNNTSLSRTGFTFNGWNTAADGSGTPRGVGSTFAITEDTTLYAQWLPDNTFSSWIADFDVGALDGPNDDPDNDGQPNFLEFALNSQPDEAGSVGRTFLKLATVGAETNVLTLTVAVRDNAAAFAAAGNNQQALNPGDNLTYLIEASNTLGDWGTPVVTPVAGGDATTIQSGLPSPDAGWSYKTFRTDGNAASDPTEFIRVKVTTP